MNRRNKEIIWWVVEVLMMIVFSALFLYLAFIIHGVPLAALYFVLRYLGSAEVMATIFGEIFYMIYALFCGAGCFFFLWKKLWQGHLKDLLIRIDTG
tara:strand:- start:30 stop:320 length:291 start_codon:yes stop_codon:yes gene_type:complete